MMRMTMLRAASSLPLRASAMGLRATRAPLVSSSLVCQKMQTRNSSHAISNPTLSNIEQRWESMPPQDQADLWMALRDRMKSDWNEMTVHEKKAAYWIAFGPHGPRAEAPAGEGWKVFRYTVYLLAVSFVVFFFTREFAGTPPKTMSKEWQEASNEYLKEQKVEPITGISSEGYTGKGVVQSKPSGKPLDSEEE